MAWDLERATEECRREAAELQRQARKAWLPSSRRFYLEIADSFLRLAEGYETQLILEHNKDRLKQLQSEQDEAA